MGQDSAETWDGGFVRMNARGPKVYVIRRRMGGKSFEVSTRAAALRAAMEQLRRFESAPESCAPTGRDDSPEPTPWTWLPQSGSCCTPGTRTGTAPRG